MPENTLLSLLTGGRYGTSADLPTIPEMAHSYIDQIKESYDQQQQRDVQIQGQGLGLLDMVGGMAKAGAMIPALTKQYKLASNGQSQLRNLIKRLSKERKSLKVDDEFTMQVLKAKTPEAQQKIYADASKQRMKLQIYEKALEQYTKFGAARPGTEDYIQTLLRELSKHPFKQ